MTRTQHPVVLIHGVFGYGRQRPFWQSGPPYWPERALDFMGANYLVVDLGALSSNHDRACEAFYQLYGGRVDYGQAHAEHFGHDRFGATFDKPLHPNWSAENPVHLVGHSVGATTAIELYQLICQDAFGVGSDYRWVHSIVSIAGPLSGTTLTHFFGWHEAVLTPYTLGHLIGAVLCLWHRFHTHFPMFKGVFDYRMPQWEFVRSYWEIISSRNRVLASPDLAVYDILPARRLERNSRLQHMDKPFLVSVVTSSTSSLPCPQIITAVMIVIFFGIAIWSSLINIRAIAFASAAVACTLWMRLRKYLFLPFMQWRMRRCVEGLHDIIDGFDRDEWKHTDGAVNLCSMTHPRSNWAVESGSEPENEETQMSAIGAPLVASATRPLHLDPVKGFFIAEKTSASQIEKHTSQSTLLRGQWHVHRVRGNHKVGTNVDPDTPELFRQLLRLIATSFEARKG